jgi:hypothetical protein
MSIELLAWSPPEDIPTESDLSRALSREGGELLFNGLPVSRVIGEALDATKHSFYTTVLCYDDVTFVDRLAVAVYHPEEQAIYIGVARFVDGNEEAVERGGRVIRKGAERGAVETIMVSYKTSAGILEWMDSIDLMSVQGVIDRG